MPDSNAPDAPDDRNAATAPSTSSEPSPDAEPRIGLSREEMGDPGLTKEDLRDVPRLPRGKGVRMPFGQVVRIGLTATMLIAVLVLAKPCADAVGNFVASFDPPDAQPAVVQPGKVPVGYVHLTPNMTPQQIQQAIDSARDAGAPAPQANPPAPPPPATSSPPR